LDLGIILEEIGCDLEWFKMKEYHRIEALDFEGPIMLIKIDDIDYKIDLRKQSKKLYESDLKIKRNYQISPSGYGIHWPDIDEDLSIDGLLGIKHSKPKLNHINKAS
jgi:hypothetical protein